MKNSIQAIVFDMDGVIIDSEPYHVKAELQTCKDFGITIPKSEWKGFKGRTASDIFYFINDKYAQNDHRVSDLVQHKTNLVCKAIKAEVQLIDGVLGFIKFAKLRYSKLGLATSSNSQIQKVVFTNFGLDKYFDEVVTGTEVKNGKPHPEPYLLIAEKLGINTSEMLVIEDSISGIKSGMDAGAKVLAITTSHSVTELSCSDPNFIVDNFKEAKTLISTLDT